MLIKVFSRGTGGGYGPVEYAISHNPFGKGQRQVSPIIKKGDPQMMMRQIDAVPFKWKYSSGVISFAKEDNPSEEQITRLMEDFEQLAFAGLPLSSHSILWVQHEESGRKELHFILPRQEVHTGKSFNAFPPGWEKKFDVLRDKYNYAYGWARPDDPVRARPVQPGHLALRRAEGKRRKTPIPPTIKETLSEHIIHLVIEGKLETRSDIVQELYSLGYEIPRQGKDYITILDTDTGKRTRLKGTLFQADFNGPLWLQRQALQKPNNSTDNKKAQEAGEVLVKYIAKTAHYNQKRYKLQEVYYGREQPQPRATRAPRHTQPGEAVSPQKRPVDSGDRVSAPSKRIPGIGFARLSVKQGIRITGDAKREILRGPKRAGIASTGSRAVTSTVRQCHYPASSLHSMGGQSGGGYGVEAFHRSNPKGSSRQANKHLAINGEQVGRTAQRQTGVTGGNVQSCHGDSERSAYETGESGGILATQTTCKTQAVRIINKLRQVNEMRLMQILAQSYMPLHVPSMATIHQSAVRVMEYLPQLVDLNLSRQLARDMDRITTPVLSELETFACFIEAKLPLAHELRLLQNTATNLALLHPPEFTPLKCMGENVMNKITQTSDKKIIKKIYQAEQYHRAEQTFWQLAHWAGGNLQHWSKVHRRVRESPFLYTIYRYHTRNAHRQFISMTENIGSDSVAWQKVVERCQMHPLLLRELQRTVEKQQVQQRSHARHRKARHLDESATGKHHTHASRHEDEERLQNVSAPKNTMNPW